uniref:YqaJ viral recombinase domain-containing protein n=1 Tax=viral metagenome TaxID=1070528 RepID=A0A6C0E4W2_9ZZZZ
MTDVLVDITHEISDTIFDNEFDSLTDDNYLDLLETILVLIDELEYVGEEKEKEKENQSGNREIFLDEIIDIDEIYNLVCVQFENMFINSSDEDYIYDLIEDAIDIYNSFKHPNSVSDDIVCLSSDNQTTSIEYYIKIIEYLRTRPQPPQRTDAWYKFRHNLITASNAYKAFESQSSINQLIYEKCQPLKTAETDSLSFVNVKSPFHWGQKYEPVSVLLYEELFKTKIEDFGCIRHDKYYFIGASPDGINVDPSSPLYGRMLEIKNVVTREITGIPKKEYAIQMQLQMEVCNLDECDFLETKFVEFESESEFYNDVSDTKAKGVIVYFVRDGKPFYVYKPLHIVSREDIESWEQDTMENYRDLVWIQNIYWRLDVLSCILVKRDKFWFESHIGQLEKVWKIIEEERVTGFSHRAPNKRIVKASKSVLGAENTNASTGTCLLNITKLKPS